MILLVDLFLRDRWTRRGIRINGKQIRSWRESHLTADYKR
jgi:hypothetical protein